MQKERKETSRQKFLKRYDLRVNVKLLNHEDKINLEDLLTVNVSADEQRGEWTEKEKKRNLFMAERKYFAFGWLIRVYLI